MKLKFLRLKNQVGLRVCDAIGVLEMLLEHQKKEAPLGANNAVFQGFRIFGDPLYKRLEIIIVIVVIHGTVDWRRRRLHLLLRNKKRIGSISIFQWKPWIESVVGIGNHVSVDVIQLLLWLYRKIRMVLVVWDWNKRLKENTV